MNQLKEKREAAGLSQKSLAALANISVRQYRRLEKSEHIPRACTALLLAQSLNSTVEELFPACEDAKTAAGDSSSSQNNCIKKT